MLAVQGVLYSMFAARLSEILDWLWFCVTSQSLKWTTRLVFSLVRFYDFYWPDRLRSPAEVWILRKTQQSLLTGSWVPATLYAINKPPKSIHLSGDWNWTLLSLVTPEVCSEEWSWTGPRRVGSWLPRSVPAMTSQNWDLASLTWRIWASAGEGCFSGNVLLSWKNHVIMVPVAAKKCRKLWEELNQMFLNQDPDVSNCINWHYENACKATVKKTYIFWFEHIRFDFEFRLGWTIFTRLHEVARTACVSADGLIDQLPVTFVIAPAAIDWKSP